jgi:hypothetical protein
LKTGLLPVLNLLITILAVMLCFVPVSLYWWKRMAPNKSFLIVAIFWLINGITYTPEIFNWHWYIKMSSEITLVYNLIDAPLILLFFYYAFGKKIFLKMLAAFAIFEIIMIVWKGYNWDSNTIIIGVGSFICLILNIWGTTLYLRDVEHTPEENVRVFVNAGFIFYYGLFAVVYVFNYIKFSRITLPYIVFINYFSICIATGLISYGIWKFIERQYREERY